MRMRPPAPPPPSGFLRRRGEPRGAAMGAGFVEICRHNVHQILSHIPATAYVPGAHVDQALSRIPATAYVPGAPAPLSRIPAASAAPYAPTASCPLRPRRRHFPYVPAAAAATATAYVPGAPAPLSRIPAASAAPYAPAASCPLRPRRRHSPYVPAAAAATPVAPYVPDAAPPLPNTRRGRQIHWSLYLAEKAAALPFLKTRRERRDRQRILRRQYLAEQAAATSCPASPSSSAAATSAVPVSHVPASAASLVDPPSHAPAATHASATRPTPLYRVPAVPSVSDASPFPISGSIPAAPSTAVTSTSPRIPASASPAAPHFSPPRELSKRATGSAFSAPRKFSQRPAVPAEKSDCQIAGAVGPPALTGPMPPPQPPPACPPRPMPPPPSPLSHTPAAAPRASTSPAVDNCSPPRELFQRAAASGCGDSPPRELSQRPAAVATDESEIVGAVGLARADQDRSVPHASATPLSCIPAAPNASATHPFPIPCIPAVPHATASQAIHYSPQRSSHSAPRPVDAATPPCGLSERPAAVATDKSNCQILGAVGPPGADRISSVPPVDARMATKESEIVGAVGPAGADRVRSEPPRDVRMASEAHVKSVPGERHATMGREEETKSVEELKRELERVSKEMNDLRNEFAELKKGMKNKDLEIEAKEAEIQSFKKAKLGCSSKDICSTRMDIDQSFHTPANEALLAEASCWTSTRRAEKLSGKNNEL